MKKLAAFLLWGFASGAYATDIVTTWETVGFEIDGYKLNYSINGIDQTPIDVPYGTNGYTIEDVQSGHYELWVEGYKGTESGESDRVNVFYVGDMVLTVQLLK